MEWFEGHINSSPELTNDSGGSSPPHFAHFYPHISAIWNIWINCTPITYLSFRHNAFRPTNRKVRSVQIVGVRLRTTVKIRYFLIICPQKYCERVHVVGIVYSLLSRGTQH